MPNYTVYAARALGAYCECAGAAACPVWAGDRWSRRAGPAMSVDDASKLYERCEHDSVLAYGMYAPQLFLWYQQWPKEHFLVME